MRNMPKTDPVQLAISSQPVDYLAAVQFMERRARDIRLGTAHELLWFLEHPPLYTAGTSAHNADLRDATRFPVFDAGRGGQYTYHGPGQRVVYVMLDLAERGRDVRAFVRSLETWIVKALADLGVEAGPRDGRVGVWVERPGTQPLAREDKIAALGIRLRKWVSFHGISLNVQPNLEHFSGITPCGIDDPRFGVTSLADLGLGVAMTDVDHALVAAFEDTFGCQTSATRPPLAELAE